MFCNFIAMFLREYLCLLVLLDTKEQFQSDISCMSSILTIFSHQKYSVIKTLSHSHRTPPGTGDRQIGASPVTLPAPDLLVHAYFITQCLCAAREMNSISSEPLLLFSLLSSQFLLSTTAFISMIIFPEWHF